MGGGGCWFVLFADFRGVDTTAMAAFKLLMPHHWAKNQRRTKTRQPGSKWLLGPKRQWPSSQLNRLCTWVICAISCEFRPIQLTFCHPSFHGAGGTNCGHRSYQQCTKLGVSLETMQQRLHLITQASPKWKLSHKRPTVHTRPQAAMLTLPWEYNFLVSHHFSWLLFFLQVESVFDYTFVFPLFSPESLKIARVFNSK